MPSKPRILIVGAGAVGQVYGRHLQLGGADVTFLVKPKHVPSLSPPLRFYPLNSCSLSDEPVTFSDYQLVTEPPQSEEDKYDQVWLCVSATALRQGWLPELCQSIGHATVVSLLPGIEDRQFLLEYVPEERLVSGLITLISYPAPLEGEPKDAEGMAYWFPPLSPTPLSGSKARRDTAVALLKAGEQPAKAHHDVGAISGFPTAVLMPLLMGLEASDWRLHGLATSDNGTKALAGVKQAIQIVAKHHGVPKPWWLALLGKVALKTILWAAPKLVPLPLETYLAYHFTKVGDQTRLFINTYIRLGKTLAMPTDSLEELEAQLVPAAAG